MKLLCRIGLVVLIQATNVAELPVIGFALCRVRTFDYVYALQN
jgi:hypothetical protein